MMALRADELRPAHHAELIGGVAAVIGSVAAIIAA
jgi:hypothetical protein